MMRSMFSGVSGLRNHQLRMDVIANNVSNVNTIGFKGSRTLFSDVFTQTLMHASGASEGAGRGGVNPTQVGLGVNLFAIDRMMTQGAFQRTDINLDLAVSGNGFFIVRDATGVFFTRNGALRRDADDNVVIPSGHHLQGWRVMETPGWDPSMGMDTRFTTNRGPVQNIALTPTDLVSPPVRTLNTTFQGNLNPEVIRGPVEPPETIGPILTGPRIMNMNITDSLGNNHVISAEFQITDNGDDGQTEWLVTLRPPANSGLELAMTGPGVSSGAGGTVNFPLVFNSQGTVVTPGSDGMDVTITNTMSGTPAAMIGENGTITMHFGGLTQYAQFPGSASVSDVEGLPAGYLVDLAVGQDGTMMGVYSNGDMRPLWQIPLAQFSNPAGLEAVGGSLFRQSANSGVFDGIGNIGVLQGGVLEMSNIDLSAEFTDMIITQRGFQASSRLITTSDDMLQELVNLRR
ncbi:MAG: flagellar hook protein FlgE [Defluviitaleaceae bacterium]|nr:flagellar hook protein FlgE [Defluviitaleaceae bacterium]